MTMEITDNQYGRLS